MICIKTLGTEYQRFFSWIHSFTAPFPMFNRLLKITASCYRILEVMLLKLPVVSCQHGFQIPRVSILFSKLQHKTYPTFQYSTLRQASSSLVVFSIFARHFFLLTYLFWICCLHYSLDFERPFVEKAILGYKPFPFVFSDFAIASSN